MSVGLAKRGLGLGDEPTPEDAAQIEAAKAAIRADHRAAAVPKSDRPGVHWDGERWGAWTRRKGMPGRARLIGRYATEKEAVDALAKAMKEDVGLIPGAPNAKAPVVTADKPSIAFPSIKPAAVAPSPRPVAPRAPEPPAPIVRAAAPRPEPTPTVVSPPDPMEAVRAFFAAVDALPEGSAEWLLMAALVRVREDRP